VTTSGKHGSRELIKGHDLEKIVSGKENARFRGGKKLEGNRSLSTGSRRGRRKKVKRGNVADRSQEMGFYRRERKIRG